MSIVAIVGSNYDSAKIAGYALEEHTIKTMLGKLKYYRFPCERPCYVIFRHGLPYRYLPHDIPYEIHAQLLSDLQCEALLLTSSVGVLDESLPLFTPMLVTDLIMLDNRLPDGRICSLKSTNKKPFHLVFQEGPFSNAMNQQIKNHFEQTNAAMQEVIYAYFPGPRTKTRSENRCLSLMGAQVNSMTMGPELVLANELGIPTMSLVVGHKYSLATQQSIETLGLAESIVKSKQALEKWIAWFFQNITVPCFANMLYQIN